MAKDNRKNGFIIGLVAPVFGFTIYYLLRFRLYTLKEFWQVLMAQRSLLSGIISISLVINIILFTVCLNKRRDQTAIGLFIATCIYGAVALGFRWFG